MTDKKVSIIMPAYNAEKYIEEAVGSVIAQTYSNWELFIIDDCSSDNTPEIAKKLSEKDSRIIFLQNEENVNVAKTRNKGFECCSGDYVALLDSDDIWLPEKLEKQLEKMEETGADISYCSYGMINEQNEKSHEDFIVPETADFEYLLKRMVISCSTAVFSHKIIENHRFRTDYYHEDFVFWLEIVSAGFKTCGSNEVLAYYRVAEGSRASNKFRSALHRWKIYREVLGLSFLKSTKYFAEYALLGFKKYKKIIKE